MHIWPANGWLEAAAVLGRYSRSIVGWSMYESTTFKRMANVLMMVVWCRGKLVALLGHAVQGSRYAGENFQELLEEQARADVFDCIERFGNPTRRYSTLDSVSFAQVQKVQEA